MNKYQSREDFITKKKERVQGCIEYWTAVIEEQDKGVVRFEEYSPGSSGKSWKSVAHFQLELSLKNREKLEEGELSKIEEAELALNQMVYPV